MLHFLMTRLPAHLYEHAPAECSGRTVGTDTVWGADQETEFRCEFNLPSCCTTTFCTFPLLLPLLPCGDKCLCAALCAFAVLHGTARVSPLRRHAITALYLIMYITSTSSRSVLAVLALSRILDLELSAEKLEKLELLCELTTYVHCTHLL